MSKPEKFGGFTLYRIFYGDEIVYLGRTMQPLQDRIRGHVFGKPMHRKIDIDLVSRIEFCQFTTQADMYLYEIYFINKYKPPLNCDDKASDELTVVLEEPRWELFSTALWDRWKEEIHVRMEQERAARAAEIALQREEQAMRKKRAAGEISEEEYWSWHEKRRANFF